MRERDGRDAGSVVSVLSPSPADLSPVADVERRDGSDWATSSWPWLRVEVDARALAGRWIEITYRTGMLEPLTRPVLRFVSAAGATDQALPGALFGRARWLGRVPDDTEAIWVSPTNRAGAFAFAIERLDVRSTAVLTWDLFRHAPRRGLIWLFAPLVGMRRAAHIQVKRVLSVTPLSRYDAWRRRGSRALDLPGFDGALPSRHVRLVWRGRAGDEQERADLLAGLRAQPCPAWSLAVVQAAGATPLPSDATISVVSPDAPLAAVTEGLDATDIVVVLTPGDRLSSFAVAILSSAAERHTDVDAFFGDTDSIDPDGRFAQPRLHPRWSDVTSASGDDLGPALAVRAGVLRRLSARSIDDGLPRIATLLADEGTNGHCAILHLRRVLLSKRKGVPAPLPTRARRIAAAPQAAGEPSATIIVPTRDRLELLQTCIRSLQRTMPPDGPEVIVVDNGSVGEDTRAFLVDLVRDPRFRVLPEPGPFNFSRLCNRAAAEARAATLVFLNNDTEMIDAGWLDPLLAWAQRPDVGAVGAKLLYPSGRVQHAGVVVGIDGFAGHFERGLARDDPGYFGRLTRPHEVSAVTAACLAVERRKFDAVGGFDEANLPVDLNDIDLCLRLGAQGWSTVFVPEVVIIHHEAASRGITHRPYERYRQEQQTFKVRWAAMIRDDPAYHPALSLDSLDAALG